MLGGLHFGEDLGRLGMEEGVFGRSDGDLKKVGFWCILYFGVFDVYLCSSSSMARLEWATFRSGVFDM